jgi:uncharacterized membrane protein
MLSRLILPLLAFWILSAQVKAESFTIKQYHTEVHITVEGYADFDEIIEVEFTESRHGIFRYIPFSDNIDGKSVNRIIQNISVEGFNFSSSKEGTNVVLKIGDPNSYVDGKQVYHIHYRVLNPLNFYEKNVEFYWDLLGDLWPVEVENFSFKIILPDKVQLTKEDVRGFSGVQGAAGQDLEFFVLPKSVEGRTTRTFQPGQGLTIALNFPKDTFQPMDQLTNFWMVHGLLIPPVFFLLAGFLAKYFARNRKQPIMTEYFPPEGISPVIAGGFVDDSVDNNDVLSLIPHLANKGYLRMESKVEKGFFKDSNHITFYKIKEAGSDLMSFEKQFFEALFSSGALVELDDLKDKFYTQMAAVKAIVRSWIQEQGWYDTDQKAFGCVTGIIGLISLGWGAFAVFAHQNMDGLALIFTAFILFFISSRFHKRTPRGNETFQKLEGFRQFVAKAERPVIERLMKDDPLYYDKTMPYALAFGYLKQWNKQFEGLLTQPPSWYSSPMLYGTDLTHSWSSFSESFPTEINNIGSVFSSSPSSSSGGGGGGGGFSGGGSGGGGGGSW